MFHTDFSETISPVTSNSALTPQLNNWAVTVTSVNSPRTKENHSNFFILFWNWLWILLQTSSTPWTTILIKSKYLKQVYSFWIQFIDWFNELTISKCFFFFNSQISQLKIYFGFKFMFIFYCWEKILLWWDILTMRYFKISWFFWPLIFYDSNVVMSA